MYIHMYIYILYICISSVWYTNMNGIVSVTPPKKESTLMISTDKKGSIRLPPIQTLVSPLYFCWKTGDDGFYQNLLSSTSHGNGKLRSLSQAF